jgi:hypothetical protein
MWLFALWIPFTYIMFAPGGNGRLFEWLSLAVVVVGALPWIAARFRLPSPREERGRGEDSPRGPRGEAGKAYTPKS